LDREKSEKMPDFCAENRRSSQIRQRNRVNGRSEGNASLPFVGFAAVRSVQVFRSRY